MKKTNRTDYFEVDLALVLKKIWHKKWVIVITALLVAGVAFGITRQFISPQYVATTRIYVVNQMDNRQLTAQDLQIGNYLVKDYKEIILSRDVLRETIEDQNLDITTLELAKRIVVLVPYDTRVISISVKDKDPNKAKLIANSLRLIAAEKIKKVTKVNDVTILEEAEAPLFPAAPNIKLVVSVAFATTLLLHILVIAIFAILNDKIIYPEDIEDNLDLPFLGFVPLQKKRG